MSRWYLQKPPNILFPNLVLWCIIMSLSVMQKDWFAIFKVKFTATVQELIWSKYDNFYCIFWTADPFATKLGIIVHYHKPMFCGEIGLLCSRSRSKQNFKMSVNVCSDDIFWIAEPFVPNLIWWCFIMSQTVFQKDSRSRSQLRII